MSSICKKCRDVKLTMKNQILSLYQKDTDKDKEIEDLVSKIAEMSENENKLKEELECMKRNIKEFSNSNYQCEELTRLKKEVEYLRNDKKLYESRLDSMNEELKQTNDICSKNELLKVEISSLKYELKVMKQNEMSRYCGNCEKLQEAVSNLKKTAQELNSEQKEREILASKLKYDLDILQKQSHVVECDFRELQRKFDKMMEVGDNKTIVEYEKYQRVLKEHIITLSNQIEQERIIGRRCEICVRMGDLIMESFKSIPDSQMRADQCYKLVPIFRDIKVKMMNFVANNLVFDTTERMEDLGMEVLDDKTDTSVNKQKKLGRLTRKQSRESVKIAVDQKTIDDATNNNTVNISKTPTYSSECDNISEEEVDSSSSSSDDNTKEEMMKTHVNNELEIVELNEEMFEPEDNEEAVTPSVISDVRRDLMVSDDSSDDLVERGGKYNNCSTVKDCKVVLNNIMNGAVRHKSLMSPPKIVVDKILNKPNAVQTKQTVSIDNNKEKKKEGGLVQQSILSMLSKPSKSPTEDTIDSSTTDNQKRSEEIQRRTEEAKEINKVIQGPDIETLRKNALKTLKQFPKPTVNKPNKVMDKIKKSVNRGNKSITSVVNNLEPLGVGKCVRPYIPERTQKSDIIHAENNSGNVNFLRGVKRHLNKPDSNLAEGNKKRKMEEPCEEIKDLPKTINDIRKSRMIVINEKEEENKLSKKNIDMRKSESVSVIEELKEQPKDINNICDEGSQMVVKSIKESDKDKVLENNAKEVRKIRNVKINENLTINHDSPNKINECLDDAADCNYKFVSKIKDVIRCIFNKLNEEEEMKKEIKLKVLVKEMSDVEIYMKEILCITMDRDLHEKYTTMKVLKVSSGLIINIFNTILNSEKSIQKPMLMKMLLHQTLLVLNDTTYMISEKRVVITLLLSIIRNDKHLMAQLLTGCIICKNIPIASLLSSLTSKTFSSEFIDLYLPIVKLFQLLLQWSCFSGYEDVLQAVKRKNEEEQKFFMGNVSLKNLIVSKSQISQQILDNCQRIKSNHLCSSIVNNQYDSIDEFVKLLKLKYPTLVL